MFTNCATHVTPATPSPFFRFPELISLISKILTQKLLLHLLTNITTSPLWTISSFLLLSQYLQSLPVLTFAVPQYHLLSLVSFPLPYFSISSLINFPKSYALFLLPSMVNQHRIFSRCVQPLHCKCHSSVATPTYVLQTYPCYQWPSFSSSSCRVR